MCGILGVVDQSLTEADRVSLDGALDSLNHRGPDARSCRLFHGHGASCALGHTRLRIIDLSPAADQPMTNEDGTVQVVYNGELYNYIELRAELEHAGHTFVSKSDTEVLVHLYEECRDDIEGMLTRLRGMFAFAVFDRARGRVVIARDRLGIKPLYWTCNGTRMAFASETRALVKGGFAGTAIDRGSLAGYLTWGVVPGPRTILSDVHELPAGCYIEWNDGKIAERSWWDLRVVSDTSGDAAERLRAALADSVDRHMIADRPVGVFLSAGLDSTTIATLAARQGQVRGLTVSFDSTTEAAVDERSVAAATARDLGIDHVIIPVTGDDAVKAFGDIVEGMDQPTSDGVNTWLVSGAARDAGLVVALSGLGGDELFGGYPSFTDVPKLAQYRRAARALPWAARSALAVRAAAKNPGGRVARSLDLGDGLGAAYRAYRSVFSAADVAALMRLPYGNPGRIPPTPRAAHEGDSLTMLEMSWYMRNQLLRDTDQMSMQHSLEVRVPLLDDRVVEAALAVAASRRLAPGKQMLATAAGVTRRRKQPFTLPFDEWMRGPLADTVREGLCSDALPLAAELSSKARRRIYERFQAGQTHWVRPWTITVLRHWAAGRGYNW